MFVQHPAAACFRAESYFKSFPDSPEASARVLFPTVAQLRRRERNVPPVCANPGGLLFMNLNPHLRPRCCLWSSRIAVDSDFVYTNICVVFKEPRCYIVVS